ncbi:iron-sulfur cluster repair di-iron protein [Paracidobacterium acidisoli]|uniref:Iron-sulfur cluster repair di-iron protein n=1 Tax=Paracidobacterium acidisoli TaxID=2303751 RepID=A0A372IKB2_9BACT|nr:iron-sulfur cluster repair di-iron protein [Paracidobacterium acidisoli]MBT9333087.1 iron-sulfur cluster repair di-iron protein [Paracidobacterium acidisoli]
MVITSETPVREIVLERPGAIPLLEELGIDYCCGGKHTLGEACSRRQLGVSTVLDMLARQQPQPSDTNWQTARLTELTQHIVEKHHAFTREQLRLLQEVAEKVQRRHGDRHPEIPEVYKAIAALIAETTHHFYCEENILFPYIGSLEEGEKPAQPPFFDTVDQPVTRMMMEHDQTGDELRHLRELTNNYQPPPDACTTFRALYRALDELERDLHQHIHLENNILFPRVLAIAREQR